VAGRCQCNKRGTGPEAPGGAVTERIERKFLIFSPKILIESRRSGCGRREEFFRKQAARAYASAVGVRDSRRRCLSQPLRAGGGRVSRPPIRHPQPKRLCAQGCLICRRTCKRRPDGVAGHGMESSARRSAAGTLMRLILVLVATALMTSCSGIPSQFSSNYSCQSAVCGPAEQSHCAIPTARASKVGFLSTSTALEPSSYCCKVCSKGKACGDSCISRDKECHTPPGCACNR